MKDFLSHSITIIFQRDWTREWLHIYPQCNRVQCVLCSKSDEVTSILYVVFLWDGNFKTRDKSCALISISHAFYYVILFRRNFILFLFSLPNPSLNHYNLIFGANNFICGQSHSSKTTHYTWIDKTNRTISIILIFRWYHTVSRSDMTS